eukprot:6177592-Pleurochrysis_carterae.AAC.3
MSLSIRFARVSNAERIAPVGSLTDVKLRSYDVRKYHTKTLTSFWREAIGALSKFGQRFAKAYTKSALGEI